MLIEAAQSRPPSSLGPSDSADNLGKENDDLLLAHAQYPPPSMLYDLTVSPASGVLSVQRGRRHGVLLRRKLRLSSTFGQVGVRLRSQSLHHACPACAFLAGVENKNANSAIKNSKSTRETLSFKKKPLVFFVTWFH